MQSHHCHVPQGMTLLCSTLDNESATGDGSSCLSGQAATRCSAVTLQLAFGFRRSEVFWRAEVGIGLMLHAGCAPTQISQWLSTSTPMSRLWGGEALRNVWQYIKICL